MCPERCHKRRMRASPKAYTVMYMHACMHTYMHACMHTCMYACIHACMHTCIHACMHTCIHAYMHACMYVCMHVCMYACMYVCMHVWYVCMYAQLSTDYCVSFYIHLPTYQSIDRSIDRSIYLSYSYHCRLHVAGKHTSAKRGSASIVGLPVTRGQRQ